MSAITTFVCTQNPNVMENSETIKNPGMARNALIHGLITGGLLILFYLLMYALGMLDQYVVQLVIYFVLLAGGMYYGTKTYRDRHLNGFMSYNTALGSTFMIALWSGILYSLFTFLFLRFFDPGLVDVMLEQAEERILKMMPEISDSDLQTQLDAQRRMMQSGMGYLWSFIGNIVVSLILALIVSIFLKREDPSHQQMV